MEYFTRAFPIYVTDWSAWIMSLSELISFQGINIGALIMFTNAQKFRRCFIDS